MKERFIRNRRLIVHYYIVAGIAAVLFAWASRSEDMTDPVIQTILGAYILAFPIVILYTRKYATHIFLFLLAFITGFYSFYHYSVEAHSILNALYFTFQLYLLDVTDVFTPDGSTLLHYPLIVEIARWSAALYTISTLFIAMYRMLEMSILLTFYQIVGNHTIVFGYNENSIDLIEDLCKKKKRVVLVADQMPNEVVDYLEELKVVVLHNRDKEENIYTKCGVASAKSVILLHKEDIDNLNELMDLRYDFGKHAKKNPDLTVYVHLQDANSKEIFLELEHPTLKEDEHFQVRLINLYELFADTLFEKYPIYTKSQDTSPAHLLIIGFGPLGQHIALKAITQSEQFEKSTPYITAIDQSMPKIKQGWQRNYPEFARHASITLKTIDVTSEPLEELIRKQDRPVTQIYVCLHEDHLDLWAGIELSTQFPHIPIYIEFTEGSIAEKWIQSEVSGDRQIYSTGTFKEVLTEEKLLTESIS